jgi:hypothetical protein
MLGCTILEVFLRKKMEVKKIDPQVGLWTIDELEVVIHHP